MSRLHAMQRISAEILTATSLLESISKSDILGRMGFEARLEELESELNDQAASFGKTAEVALVFNGAPVYGSSAISASFTSKVIEAFQQSVSTVFALVSGDGTVGGRGPTKGRNDSALHITGLVHGSFGFVLEEFNPDESELFETPLKAATESVMNILNELSSDDEDAAQLRISEIDKRLFSNLRGLIQVVHDERASMELLSEAVQVQLTGRNLERAFERTSLEVVSDEEIVLSGRLLGILPKSRIFELEVDGNVLKGRVSPKISEEYMQHLDENSMLSEAATCTLIKRTFSDTLQNEKSTYSLVKVVVTAEQHEELFGQKRTPRQLLEE